ncbi:hypothetical protein BACFRA24663_18280 [Bacteroides fragilis]|uniref:glycosyltransferase n=1 Tax=Bacteroides fragilis TaxID=817 RepID=UPI0036D5C421
MVHGGFYCIRYYGFQSQYHGYILHLFIDLVTHVREERLSLSDIEIILIDDESPDNCPKICDDYAAQYPNIKVIHKKNAGLGMACNSGLDVATGEYVAFCDSDDYVDSDMYMTMYNVAQKYTCDAVFTGLKRITMAGIPTGSH